MIKLNLQILIILTKGMKNYYSFELKKLKNKRYQTIINTKLIYNPFDSKNSL